MISDLRFFHPFKNQKNFIPYSEQPTYEPLYLSTFKESIKIKMQIKIKKHPGNQQFIISNL